MDLLIDTQPLRANAYPPLQQDKFNPAKFEYK